MPGGSATMPEVDTVTELEHQRFDRLDILPKATEWGIQAEEPETTPTPEPAASDV